MMIISKEMFIKYDSRKLKAYILKKDNTSTNDDFFFFIQVSTSSIVMKQTESVFLQGFITPTYYHRKWEREKERDRERCLFFKYRRRKNLKQNITHQFRSQSMLLFILTESSIYIYENEWIWSNKWFSSCVFFSIIYILLE